MGQIVISVSNLTKAFWEKVTIRTAAFRAVLDLFRLAEGMEV